VVRGGCAFGTSFGHGLTRLLQHAELRLLRFDFKNALNVPSASCCHSPLSRTSRRIYRLSNCQTWNTKRPKMISHRLAWILEHLRICGVVMKMLPGRPTNVLAHSQRRLTTILPYSTDPFRHWYISLRNHIVYWDQ
jgi:hypothetical protein